MSDQETSSEAIGRQAGETIGRHFGGLAGRAVGELVASGLAGVGMATDSERNATDDATANENAENETADGSEATDESETTEEESERPSSHADLEAMSYRELQQLAKDVDVTANLARDEMEDRLVETLDLDE